MRNDVIIINAWCCTNFFPNWVNADESLSDVRKHPALSKFHQSKACMSCFLQGADILCDNSGASLVSL